MLGTLGMWLSPCCLGTPWAGEMLGVVGMVLVWVQGGLGALLGQTNVCLPLNLPHRKFLLGGFLVVFLMIDAATP